MTSYESTIFKSNNSFKDNHENNANEFGGINS